MKNRWWIGGLVMAFALLVLALPRIEAYERYKNDAEDPGSNCALCHGDFTSSVSPKGTVFPSNNKHEMHRASTAMNTDCNLCHTTGDSRNPFLGSSDGTNDTSGMGCVGCHDGAGLRLHHANNGFSCSNAVCHTSEPPVPAENLPPPYYGSGDTNADNPCNTVMLPNSNENWSVGDFVGLDNDGDNMYDANDPDCAAAVCGNGTIEDGEDCDDGNTDGGDCCDANCLYEASGSPCLDDNVCNGDETCDGAGICLPGTQVDCSDGVACTDDTCDPATGNCVNTPNNANCPDDTLFCNGEEFCDESADCSSTGNPCTGGDACIEETDTCEPAGDCGNGIVDAGEQCDDGNTSNGDCCGATCQYESSGSSCENSAFCDGAETCDGAGICQAGTPPSCDDGVGCTIDSCDTGTDQCLNLPSDGLCPDDALFCTGAEFCDPTADCSSTGDPCTEGTTCNDTTDSCDVPPECGNGTMEAGEQCDDGNTSNGDCCSAGCQYEPSGSSCEDASFCNGAETCDGAGTCQSGTPVDCVDDISCTIDSCDETTDQCRNVPSDALCPDDGLFCTGAEFCDPTADCSSTGDPCSGETTCNDTTDACDPLTGCGNGIMEAGEQCDDGNTSDGDCCSATCQYEPAGSGCEDSVFCNGAETCDGAGTCQAGTPPSCDDGVGCTVDSCDPSGDQCLNAPSDALCPDDGLFCNGTEFCDSTADCSSSGDPCTGEATCNETADTCDAVMDLDIAAFRVTRRTQIDARRPKEVSITFVVKNEGTTDVGTRSATVEGMQNGVLVFSETQQVGDAVGNGRTTYAFGPYQPTAVGDIIWNATIFDDDPDDDMATATTRVVEKGRTLQTRREARVPTSRRR